MSSTTSLATTNVLPVLREFLDEIFDELEEVGGDEAECLRLAGQISEQKAIIDSLIRSKTQLEDDLAASIDKFHAWIAAHIHKDWADVSPVWKEWLTIRQPGRVPKRLVNVPGPVQENVVSRSGSSGTVHTTEGTASRESAGGAEVRDEVTRFGTTGDEGEVTDEVRDATRGTTSNGGPPPFEGLSPEVRLAVERGERRAMEQATKPLGNRGELKKGKGKGMAEAGEEEEGDEVNDDGAADDGAGETEEEEDEDRDEDEGDAPSGSMDPDNARPSRTTRSSRIRSKATVFDTEDEDEDAGEPPARTTRKRNASNPPEEPRKRLRKAVVEVPANSSGSRESVRTTAVKEGKGVESKTGEREWFTEECLEKKSDEFRAGLLAYLLDCRKEDHKDYSSLCDWCTTTGISKCFGPTKTMTCFYCVRMRKSCSHREKTGKGKGKLKEKKPKMEERKSDRRGKAKSKAQAAAEKDGEDAEVIEIDAEDDAAGSTQPAPTPRKVTLRVKKDPKATWLGGSSLPTGVMKTLDLDNKLGRRSAQIQTLEREISQWEIDSDLLLARIAAGKEMLAALKRKNGEVE